MSTAAAASAWAAEPSRRCPVAGSQCVVCGQRAASEQIAMGANGEISDAIEGENGWVQAEDPDTGEVFYWNEETGEMRYDKE